eukprot:TRINITY_DN9530_c0_g1_i1.p1 TRINITY_DN9530_c0_g1~~TRINITY_DN9530_c0_g1_i1.p1  ORF type:complete len:473 (-),score=87.93 TRINITY_DN9530_c0_g1_i1:278-1648(-)
MALATASLLGLGNPLSRSSHLPQELPSREFAPSLRRSSPRGAIARVPKEQAHARGGVALAATGAVAAVGVRRKLSRRSKAWRRRFFSAVQRQAEGDGANADPLLAEAKAAAEAAKLRLEAEKLRAEAARLQQGVTAEQFSSRADRLLGGMVGIGLSELLTRFKGSESLDLTEEQGKRLAKACGLGQVPADVQEQLRKAEAFNLPNLEELRQKATPQPIFFRKEELTSEAFDRELRLIEADVRQARQARAQADAARDRAAQETTSQSTASQPGQQAAGAAPAGQAAKSSQPQQEGNTDTSFGTRILACLPYLLPLGEAFRLAYPLAVAFPIFAILFGPVAIVAELINAFPLGASLILLVFIVLAQSKDQVPRLTRFNLEQAVLLDIAMTIPTLILTALGSSGAAEPAFLLGGLTFLGVFAITAYCAATTLEGKEPDGIPVISKTAKNVIERQTFFGD